MFQNNIYNYPAILAYLAAKNIFLERKNFNNFSFLLIENSPFFFSLFFN